MRVSIVVLNTIKYNSITGQALVSGVPDTDLLCGPARRDRELTVAFRGPSALAYPPLCGERIRFEYETAVNGMTFACQVISREAPGDLSCAGPDGIIAGTGHNPPAEYTARYIGNIIGLEFGLSGTVTSVPCGRQVMDCARAFVKHRGKNPVLFLEAVSSDFLSVMEDAEADAISSCGLSSVPNRIYAINPLVSDRIFFNAISGGEVSLPAVYADIYRQICLKGDSGLKAEINGCVSQLPEFARGSALKLLINSAVLSGSRFSDRFFLSLDISREHSSRLVRSLGPRAIEIFMKDPYLVSRFGFTSPLSVARFLESEDVRFGKISDFVKAVAGAILDREYSNGTEAVPEAEFKGMLLDEVNASGMFKADMPLISEAVSGENCDMFGPYATRNIRGNKFFIPSSLAFGENFLASRLVSLNAAGTDIPGEKLVFPGVNRIFPTEKNKNENHLLFGKYLLDGFASVFGDHGIGDYAVSQIEAVGKLFSSPGIDILTGGPGSGKTTIIKVAAILSSFAGIRVNILSPTGKAVKRAEELLFASSVPGWIRENIRLMTVHKYVYSMSGKNDPSGTQVFIVDECSMLDTEIFTRLISLIPEGSKLILSGDTDQLASAGGGSPFCEIIDSGIFRHIVLIGSYRHTNLSIQALAEKIRSPERLYEISEMCGSCGGDIYDLRDEIRL